MHSDDESAFTRSYLTGPGPEPYFPDLPPRKPLPWRAMAYVALAGIFLPLLTFMVIQAAQPETPVPLTVGPIVDTKAVPVPIRGRILAVHDGDTVTVAVSVRLAEIDAPELKQPYGAEARDILAALLSPPVGKHPGTLVNLRIESIDRYGRAVGYLRDSSALIDTDVNLILIQQGAAWQYKAYSKDKSYTAAEEDARYNKRGLWEKESPQAPWDFRKRAVENPFKEVPPEPDTSGILYPLRVCVNRPACKCLKPCACSSPCPCGRDI